MLTAQQVATRLNMSEATFGKRLPEFERQGFPTKDKLFDKWDIVAVELWLDLRAGIPVPEKAKPQLDWNVTP
jgi:hypothetical protein